MVKYLDLTFFLLFPVGFHKANTNTNNVIRLFCYDRIMLKLKQPKSNLKLN